MLHHHPMMQTEPNLPRDRLNSVGMFIVGFAAAVLSFNTWVRLAEAIGFTAFVGLPGGVTVRIAWLYPLAVDVYAFAASRMWLSGGSGSVVTRYASRNAIGAIGLSVVGNALFHGFSAAGWVIKDSPVLVILIGGIPPLLLGLVVHLNSLVNRERQRIEPVQSPTEPKPARVPRIPEPRQPTDRTPNRASGRESEPTGPPLTIELVGVHPAGVSRIGAGSAEMVEAVRPFVAGFVAERGRTPGRHATRNELARLGFRVGMARAGEIAELAAAG